MDAQTPNQ